MHELTTLIYAQSTGGGLNSASFQNGVNQLISAIQTVSLVAVPLLIVAGFGVLMWSGFSDNFRRIAIRMIGFAFVGAIGVFLFAQPLANLITSAVGQGGTTGG